MSFNRYYQNELAFLRDMGRDYGEAHPGVAGMLAERGGDPDVERLLEGFAFLTGAIRQRIDDALPELVESLSEMLAPHLLRPVPANSILEFAPALRSMRGRQLVPAGTEVRSKPVRGTACRFRTTTDLALLPITLLSQRLDDSSATRPTLSLSFRVGEGGHEAVFRKQGILLHLHGDLSPVSQLYLWLMRHVRHVRLRGKDSGVEVPLPKTCLNPAGFQRDEALWPWPRLAPQGFRLLMEYYALPSKFLFVNLTELDRASELRDEVFEVVIEFERPPPLPSRLADDVVRLHCVPVTNLFEVDTEPVRLKGPAQTTLLRAAGMNPHHMELFSVDSVVATPAGQRGMRRTYQPFHGFRHQLEDGALGYYVLRRVPSPIDDGLNYFLSLQTPRDAEGEVLDCVLSVQATSTNRSLPAELHVGDICVPTSSSPTGVPFRNIGLVSRPTRPPLGSELHWRMLTHLAASRRGLGEVDTLRSLLTLYNLQELADHPVGRVNRARVDSIAKVDARAVTRVLQAAPVRGLQYDIEVNGDGFNSIGDAYLFGSVLERVLATQARVNSFTQALLRLMPTKQELRWPPRTSAI